MAVPTAPWQRGKERCIGATGRVLADGRMLEVGLEQELGEEQAFETHCDGAQFTLDYMAALGSAMSPAKSK
eukprot:7042107-Alexandrium_andersonii.AAC.1